MVARSDDGGGSWGEPRRVAEDDWVFPGCPHAGPSLAVDGAGTLHVGWYTGEESRPGLYYARSSDRGESFSDAFPLLSDAWVPPSQVAMAVGEGGDVHLAWEDRRADVPAFLYAAVGADLATGEAVRIPGTNPTLAASADGVLLAWLDGDRVRARRAGGSR